MNLTPREKDKLMMTRDQVMEGISEMTHAMQVEATFPDGTKLISIHDPIR